jgi:hypothetical protein
MGEGRNCSRYRHFSILSRLYCTPDVFLAFIGLFPVQLQYSERKEYGNSFLQCKYSN